MGLFLLWLHMTMSSFRFDEAPDELLLQRYRATKQQEYLGVLFNRYIHILFGICMKYFKDETRSEDAVLQLYEVVAQKVLAHQIDNFGGWVTTVARNHCLMALRQKKAQRKRQQQYVADARVHMESDTTLHPTGGAEEKEMALNRLSEAIGQLNEEQRMCIELFFLQEKSYQEIVDLTGWDYKAVKSHIQNGKRNLKKIMQASS